MRVAILPRAVLSALLAATGCAPSPRLAVEMETVEAEGWAPVDPKDAAGTRQRALAEAQRRAVEKATGPSSGPPLRGQAAARRSAAQVLIGYRSNPLYLSQSRPAMAQKILVIDDDASIRKITKKYLAARGYSVVVTDNGSEALLLVREAQPDLLLLDAEMPGLDGYAVCRVLKKGTEARQTPIIIMSGARIEEKDVLSGFEGGADDYVLKPFSLPVLLVRIQAVLRRYSTSSQMEKKLRKRGLVLDPAGRTVKANGKPVELTRKEFDLLATLIGKAGRVLSVPYLLETVWGYDPADYNDPRTVEVHVSRLRSRLGPKIAKHIVNVIGHGYKFEA